MADDGADNKTEEPTGRRLEQAREKGSVAYTREMGSVLGVVAIGSVLYKMGTMLYEGMMNLYHGTFANLRAWDYGDVPFWSMIYPYLHPIISAVLFVFAAGFFAPLIAHFAQKGIAPMFAAAAPSLAKLDPIQGVKKLFAFEAMTNFGKSAVKAIGLILIYYYVVKPYLTEVVYSASMPYESALTLYGDIILKYLLYAVIFMILIVALDYEMQRRHLLKTLMMTRHEIKEEMKETDGNPEMKGRLREIQRERSKREIDKQVPKATVIVTNPTHFAVALRYQKGKTPVPRVVAKGADAFCMRIREIAKQHNVPIIENPPLARALYRDVKVGQDIPKQFYKAVAKIIATIMRLEEVRKGQNEKNRQRDNSAIPHIGL